MSVSERKDGERTTSRDGEDMESGERPQCPRIKMAAMGPRRLPKAQHRQTWGVSVT